MKNIKIIFILSLLLVSCGDKGGGNWSAEMKATFMDSCVSEATLDIDVSTARDYCDCCLVELQKVYDMQDMMRLEVIGPDMLHTRCGWIYHFNCGVKPTPGYWMQETYKHLYKEH